jgi:DNA-directed RNA polymerase subunit RPC12/RpoP
MLDVTEREETEAAPAGGEATCPHCHKTFVPDPLARPTARQRGYKCPHCRLFVPIERAVDAPLARASDETAPRRSP